MSMQLQWIGHASFRIADEQSVVYIDPWKLADSPHDADVVFVSHDHFDHCSPEDVAKVSKATTSIVASADAIAKLGATEAATPGDHVTIGEVTIEAVAAYNVDKACHPKGNHWCGAVITMGPVRVYYAGDTDLIPEMSDLTGVDVALLPVGGTYTLDAAAAARACRIIAPATAIPYHWGDIVGDRADAEAFAEEAGCEVKLLAPGETASL